MNIIIDLPVKDEIEKKVLMDYLKEQWEIFLKYYSVPEYKIKSDVENEIINQDDYVKDDKIDNWETVVDFWNWVKAEEVLDFLEKDGREVEETIA